MPSEANYCEDCNKVIPEHQKLCNRCWKKKYGDTYEERAPRDDERSKSEDEDEDSSGPMKAFRNPAGFSKSYRSYSDRRARRHR